MRYRDGDPEQAAHIAGRYRIEESSKLRAQKFKMFFAGLVFATVSFIGTHPVDAAPKLLKIAEATSLISLLLAELILLAQLAEYKVTIGEDVGSLHRKIGEIVFFKIIGFWALFIIGMSLMVIDRSVMMFLSN